MPETYDVLRAGGTIANHDGIDPGDLEAGSRAAVPVGVTAVLEMPNTDPQTTTPEALADEVRRARGRTHCDTAFDVDGTRENARLPQPAG